MSLYLPDDTRPSDLDVSDERESGVCWNCRSRDCDHLGDECCACQLDHALNVADAWKTNPPCERCAEILRRDWLLPRK